MVLEVICFELFKSFCINVATYVLLIEQCRDNAWPMLPSRRNKVRI